MAGRDKGTKRGKPIGRARIGATKEAAIRTALARKACASNPRLYFTHMLLAAALGLKGELEEARAILAEGVKIRPEFNSLARLRAYTWGSSEYWALRECTIDLGLRRAGMGDE